MKRNIILIFAILVLLCTGCARQEETVKADADTASAETETVLAYKAVDGTEQFVEYKSVTVVDGQIWFLGSDGQTQYACTIDMDGTNFSQMPLLERTSDYSINRIAFSAQRICYETLEYLDSEDGTDTDAWLYGLEPDGTEAFSIHIDGTFGLEDGDEETYVNSIAMAADGSIFFTTPNALYQLDQSGALLNSLAFSSHEYTACASAAGEIFLQDGWDMASLVAFDTEAFSVGEEALDISAYTELYTGADGYDFYALKDDGFYGLQLEDQSETCLLELERTDRVQQVLPLGNQQWLMTRSNYYNSDETMYTVSYTQATPKTVLTLAVTDSETLDSYIDLLIQQFNFKQTEYEIEAVTYSDKELSMAVAAGDLPDMILFDNSATWEMVTEEACVRNGALCDLYDFMEADSELTPDQLLSNIRMALEYEGGLYSLPYGFQFRTLYASTEYAAPENWTLREMLDVAAQLPDGVLIKHETQSSFLQNVMQWCLTSFVDSEAGSCDFENQLFYDLLALCRDTLPASYDDYDTMGDPDFVISVAFSSSNLSDICEIMDEAGDSVVWTGFPDANGGQVRFSPSVSITTGCEVPEAAWDFVRSFVTLPGTYFYVPLRTSDFEAGVEALQDSEYTQETIDRVANLARSAVSVTEMRSPIPDIVVEEAAAYFSGDKSAEDVAHIIQDRVGIYLSERS